MMRLDQDRNVMGYPSSNMNYPQPQPQPQPQPAPHHRGYPHDPNVVPNGFNRPPSLPVYPGQQPNPHPSYPVPTNGYPPTPGGPANHKGYSNVASFAYYKTQVYQPLEPGRVSEGGSSFIRFITLLLIVLVAGLCTLTFIIWVLFGTEIPDFCVSSFSVPTLNISESSSVVIGKWEGNVTVTNLNEKLEVGFNRGTSSIFYQNHVVALDHIKPFHMGNHTKGFMHPTLQTTPTLVNQIPEELFLDLLEDRKNGSILFSLRIGIEAVFKANGLWRKEKLKIFCEDLEVVFNGDSGVGTLTSGHDNHHRCLVFT